MAGGPLNTGSTDWECYLKKIQNATLCHNWQLYVHDLAQKYSLWFLERNMDYKLVDRLFLVIFEWFGVKWEIIQTRPLKKVIGDR